jgi:DNA-binding CsgD family transcriptional regulator
LSRKLDPTWGESWTLNNMGKVMQALGDHSVALSYFKRSEAMARALGAKRYIALALESLGKLAASQHDVVGASRYYRECIQVFEEIGEKAGVASCLEGMAGVASQTGQARLAARLCAAASALREAIAAPIAPVEFPAYEQTVAGVRAQLDDKTWEEEAERGRAFTFEQAVECATQLALEITDPTRAAAATTLHDLTRREVEVLHLLSEGLSNQELAARLLLTVNTVRAHLYSIYNKLNVETRTAAVQLAREYDLV